MKTISSERKFSSWLLAVSKGKHHQLSYLPSQSGFTIIESLVALIVVAILLAALSPIIVLATATRLQARRVELATQAARTYIDGVRSGAIIPPPNSIATSYTLSSYPAPVGGSLQCPDPSKLTPKDYHANPYCSSPPSGDMYCYGEGDGTCDPVKSYKDMVVQAFWINPASPTNSGQGYTLGVRVYRADAFKDDTPLKKGCDLKTRQATFSAGTGFRKAPLVEMTTEINTGAKFDDFYSRLKTSSVPACKP